MAVSLTALLVKTGKAKIYEYALGIAESLGLPVSSWQAGDPTRSLFHLESDLLATLEDVVIGFIKSGFLDYAEGVWLKILAKQVFNVDVPEATYATCTVELTNGGGGLYVIDAGDLTFKSTINGKTYHNTSGGTLNPGPGTTLLLDVEADEAGSESTAGIGEIDSLVTTLLGVTVSNTTAAVGIDEQDEATTRQQCRDKLGSLSPNGPADAYRYVALNPELTGTNNVTRARVYSDSDTGDVTVYVAGPSGAVAGADVTAVADAIATWATPLCITTAVASAAAVTVPITYEAWIYASVNKSEAEIQDEIQSALETMLASRPIGGDIVAPATTGKLYKSLIESTIRGVYPQCFRVSVTLPAGDTSLANNEVAVIGTVTGTINLEVNP